MFELDKNCGYTRLHATAECSLK